MLDRIHENSNSYANIQAHERRRASQYNSKAGGEAKNVRNFSPAGPIQDPFKKNTGDLEDAGNGKSILDKMYQSSMDYWKRQKVQLSMNHISKICQDGLKDSSKANREAGANRYNKKDIEEQEVLSSYRSGTNKVQYSTLVLV